MTTYEDLMLLTLDELRACAQRYGVDTTDDMSRSELLEAVSLRIGIMPMPLSSATLLMPQAPPTPAEQPPELPTSYGVDEVVLLVRDPEWLYAYIDLSAETWGHVSSNGLAGDRGTPVLRLYEVGDPDVHHADVGLNHDARDWYLPAPRPDTRYFVDFGYLSAEGEFHRVARSNEVRVPRVQPSEDVDETWGSLYDAALRLSLGGVPSPLAYYPSGAPSSAHGVSGSPRS